VTAAAKSDLRSEVIAYLRRHGHSIARRRYFDYAQPQTLRDGLTVEWPNGQEAGWPSVVVDHLSAMDLPAGLADLLGKRFVVEPWPTGGLLVRGEVAK
jgi:hypothetical protein